jgi:L-2,4-diaminobutyrate transaminase
MIARNHNLTFEQMDRQSLIHPFTNLKDHASGATPDVPIICEGSGIKVRDQHGRWFIDAFAGLYCVNIGYGRMEVVDAIHEQARKLAFFHINTGHSNEPATQLADRLVRMAPANISKVFFGLSGSDANDTNVKLIWYYNNAIGRPAKKKIIGRDRGYHGGTVMGSSLSGLAVIHKGFDLPIGPVKHTIAPHYYWGAEAGMSERQFSRHCAEELDKLIIAEGPDTVAAFIAEPVMGTGGIVPPPEGYWDEIQSVLRRHDVKLIADEIVCAFGRLGYQFGSELYALEPDLITVAKGITSGYLPLSASLISERIWQGLERGADIYGPFAHTLTYSAHPLGAAAALANLDVIEKEGLVMQARSTGDYLQQRLHAVFGGHPMVGEVRGVGLLGAVELVADRKNKTRFDPSLGIGRRVVAECRKEGVIIRAMPGGDTMGFSPPLVISRPEIDDVLDRCARALVRVADALTREIGWRGS